MSPGIVRKPYGLSPDFSHLNHEGHLDLLLNEQGIHHLSLPGLERKKDAPIVFAIFEPSCAFLLDLARHDEYQSDRFARISFGNWPNQHFRNIQADALLDGKGNAINLNDQQRTHVRNRAINTPINISDRTYVLAKAGGVAANLSADLIVR